MLETGHSGENGTYDQLKSRAMRALDRGEVGKAGKLYEWAYTEATRRGDPALIDRAFCNLSMVANVRCEGARFIPGLRDVAGRSDDPETRCLAAHNLAYILSEDSRSHRKARFYAELALHNAEHLESAPMAAAATHLYGLLWLMDSELQRAQRWLERSMELLEPEVDPPTLAMEGSNLGYCLTLMHQYRRALALLETGVDTISRARCGLYENVARLNLGFSLLEMGEIEWAAAQARKVLENGSDREVRKYALYLSGEALANLDRPRQAREAFRLLQDEYFPGIPTLADELVAHRTSGVISWLA